MRGQKKICEYSAHTCSKQQLNGVKKERKREKQHIYSSSSFLFPRYIPCATFKANTAKAWGKRENNITCYTQWPHADKHSKLPSTALQSRPSPSAQAVPLGYWIWHNQMAAKVWHPRASSTSIPCDCIGTLPVNASQCVPLHQRQFKGCTRCGRNAAQRQSVPPYHNAQCLQHFLLKQRWQLLSSSQAKTGAIDPQRDPPEPIRTFL